MCACLSVYSAVFLSILLCPLASSDQVEIQCRKKCDNVSITIADQGSGSLCKRDCRLSQCHSGCQLYKEALQTSCNAVCTNETFRGNIVSFERQNCLKGCNLALDIYANNLTERLGSLGRPVLRRDTETFSSVQLRWESKILPNVTYVLQIKNVDLSSDWAIFNQSGAVSSKNILVTGLQPFTTYKFKILAVLTPNHFLESNESVPITTRAHGVPSDFPRITSLTTPSPSVLSVTWEPPLRPNGPLLSYKIQVHPQRNERLRSITKEVLANVSSWTFSQLQPSLLYIISVSARNEDGEGPTDVRNITTPNPGNLSQSETPYLILGADNMVLRQNLINLIAESDTLHKDRNSSILINGSEILFENERGKYEKGIGIHVEKKLLFVSDSGGKVMNISLGKSRLQIAVYNRLEDPKSLTVDWLNDVIYIVSNKEIYQCGIEMPWMCRVALDGLDVEPKDIKVDPINGFLYFTIAAEGRGLYRVDLGDLDGMSHPRRQLIIRNELLSSFTIDYQNVQLYFPNDTQNTMLATFLDGSDITNIRPNVIRPDFQHVVSMAYHGGLFYWTNGEQVLQEEFDPRKESYRHNSMLFFEKHFRGFNMMHPTAQPKPVPHSPPSNIEVIFSVKSANITWNKPHKMNYQGNGAWNTWDYEISLTDETNVTHFNVSSALDATIEGLEGDTRYAVRIRAVAAEGYGPWSEPFIGRTLRDDPVAPMLLMGTGLFIREMGLDGKRLKSHRSPWGVGDITWYKDQYFWTGPYDGGVFGITQDLPFPKIYNIMDAACLAFDWLAQKLYWSNVKQIVIRRCDIKDECRQPEIIYLTSAKQLVVDSLQGRMYWITTHSVEVAHLNGDGQREYFSVPHFAGKQVHSLALDQEHREIFWLVQSFESQDLYVSPTIENAIVEMPVVVKLVGRLKSVAKHPCLQVFNDRLIWVDSNNRLKVGDRQGNYSAVLSHPKSNISSVVVVHSSLHQYPDDLDESTLVIIPEAVPVSSIQVKGDWSKFNVTWQPSTEVNYGEVFYELSLEAPNQQYELIRELTWHEVDGIPPYSLFTLSIRPFTYWGYAPLITHTLRSPMSVPTKPLTPRVYITHRKDAMTSQLSTAADFRWLTPNMINGIIDQHIVYYRRSNRTGLWDHSVVDASARHFILDNLNPNCTYYFQVQACTVMGCGPRSDVISAVTDSENPVPKLLIASSSELRLSEVEGDFNTSVTMATGSPIAMAFLAQDGRLFWIDQTNSLVEGHIDQQRKILQLNGTGKDLTVDWISRTLYLTEEYSDESVILSYDLERQQLREVITRPTKIGSIIADPFSSTLFWTDIKEHSKGHMMRSDIHGEDVLTLFSSDNLTARRRRRSRRNAPCNCASDVDVSPVVAMDHSMKGITKLYFVDVKSNTLVATDTDTCQCDIKLRTTEKDGKGLPPDSMTADHVRIYWSNVDEGVYSLNKVTGEHRLLTSQKGVRSIDAYGQHLQPLPGAECLNPHVENKTMSLMSADNTSLTFMLGACVRPVECQAISLPAVKYTLYYTKLETGETTDSVQCDLTEANCAKQESYERLMTVSKLEPNTEYVFQVAVSNYYTEYLSEELGPPILFTTTVGVPSPVENVTAETLLPFEIKVTFDPPAVPNGPPDSLLYVVKWTQYTVASGTLEGHTAPSAGRHRHRDRKISLFVPDLQPAREYELKVLAYDKTETYYSESKLAVTATTFVLPGDIVFLGSSTNSINVSWTSPKEDSIHTHNILMKKYVPGELMEAGDWTELESSLRASLTVNNTTYYETFSDLEPYAKYVFRVNLLYRSSNGFLAWPDDPRFVFSTSIVEAMPSDDDTTLAIAVTFAIIFVLGAGALAVVWFLLRRRRLEKKRKPSHFVNGARGPDTELAILRELPHTTVQQNNTLYAISIVPTDEDVAALPHFSRDQLNLTKFLGSGAFGEVFEGLAKNILGDESGDTKVAVKTLRKSASEQEKEEFLKEALLMSNFKHEHILSLLGVCLDNDPQFIILELMEGGDLLSFLRNGRPTSFMPALLNLSDLVKICVHVARGCKYLEDMHFVHRDLAARNCLVSSKDPSLMVVKIGDFGLARDIYKNDYYRKEGEGLLPVRWMSPESLVDGVFTTQSDIWAFGVLVWEVITLGQQPYPARTNIEVLHYVRAGGRLDRPDNCPDDLHQLIIRCWSFPHEDRPCFASILDKLEEFHQKSFDEDSEFSALWSKHPNNDEGGYGSLPSTGSPRQRPFYSTAETDPTSPYNKELNNNGRAGLAGSPSSLDTTNQLPKSSQQMAESLGYLQPRLGDMPKYLELISDPADSPPISMPLGGARPKNGSVKGKSAPDKQRTSPKFPKTNYAQISAPNSADLPTSLGKSREHPRGKQVPPARAPPGIHYAQLASFDANDGLSDSEFDSQSVDSVENLPIAPALSQCVNSSQTPRKIPSAAVPIKSHPSDENPYLYPIPFPSSHSSSAPSPPLINLTDSAPEERQATVNSVPLSSSAPQNKSWLQSMNVGASKVHPNPFWGDMAKKPEYVNVGNNGANNNNVSSDFNERTDSPDVAWNNGLLDQPGTMC